MYLGLRVLTAALWAAATALLFAGSVAMDPRVALMLFMWSSFLTTGAAVTTVWVLLEHILVRESDRNARITADAVAEALRQLNEDGHLRSVGPSTRRGT